MEKSSKILGSRYFKGEGMFKQLLKMSIVFFNVGSLLEIHISSNRKHVITIETYRKIHKMYKHTVNVYI